MIDGLIFVGMVLLALSSFVSLYRAYQGPTTADRVVAINVVSSKVTAMIVLLAVYLDQPSYIHVALVYAMLGFLATIGVSKYLLKGKLK